MWKVLVMKKNKARKIERVFITNGALREGYFPSEAVAQAECDRRNNA